MQENHLCPVGIDKTDMKPLQPLELDDIQIFCRTAESNSFTDASISLDVTPSAVSKAVRRLEKKLKVKLFHRSTRKMRLTEEGQSYYEICRQSLENIQEIESHLLNKSTPRGTLKISMPDSLAINKLIPVLNGFIEKYTDQLKIEVYLSTASVDFLRENIDVAIRIGDVGDDNLVARKFAVVEQKLVASPKYLAKYGKPKSLSDLAEHKCIGLKFSNRQHVWAWRFKNAQRLNLDYAVIYDDPLGAIKTVVNGFGVIQLLDFIVNESLEKDELIELFPEERPEPLDVHIVYPSGQYVPAKVRAFIDYLFENTEKDARI